MQLDFADSPYPNCILSESWWKFNFLSIVSSFSRKREEGEEIKMDFNREKAIENKTNNLILDYKKWIENIIQNNTNNNQLLESEVF